MRQGLIFKLSVGLICVAMAAFASPALAKKHKKRAAGLGGAVTTVTTTGNPANTGQLSTAVATCPSGTQALGGGFSVPFSTTAILAVTSSFRSAPGSWTVAGESFGPGIAVTAFAYCRTVTKTTIQDATGSATVAAGLLGSGTATATCPPNTKLVAGGFESTRGPAAGSAVVPQDNLSTSPGTWSVRALNNGPTAQTLTAHAYCAGKLRQAQLLSATNSASVPRFDEGGPAVSATTSKCPLAPKAKGKKKHKKKHPPRRLSDGGFSTSAAGPAVIPVESHIGPGNGWLVSVVNGGQGGVSSTVSLTSQGICA